MDYIEKLKKYAQKGGILKDVIGSDIWLELNGTVNEESSGSYDFMACFGTDKSCNTYDLGEVETSDPKKFLYSQITKVREIFKSSHIQLVLNLKLIDEIEYTEGENIKDKRINI